MQDSDDLLSLEELFKDAKRHIREKAAAAKVAPAGRKPKPGEAPRPSELYTNPDNWIAGRTLALVHSETQTLIGNFRELLHRSVPGVRRLVREETPVAVSEVELVTGDWGITPTAKLVHAGSTLVTRTLSLPLVLSNPPMESRQAADIAVLLQGAGILRIDLINTTLFFTEGEALSIPFGTNILPVLAHECKVRIRQELDRNEH